MSWTATIYADAADASTVVCEGVETGVEATGPLCIARWSSRFSVSPLIRNLMVEPWPRQVSAALDLALNGTLKRELQRGLQFRGIPCGTVIQDRISTPATCGCRTTHLLQVLRCIAVGPLLPSLNVAMSHRVVQDIVHRRVEVPFRFHCRFRGVAPNLAAAPVVRRKPKPPDGG